VGGAIVYTNVDNEDDSSFIFALAQRDIPSMAAMDGEYAGVLFDDSLNSGEKVAPLAVACVSDMCTGKILAEAESGAVDEGMVDTGTAGTGRTLMSCVAQSPGDVSKMFNVRMVSV
jgi:hypothetical protein